MQKSFSAEQLRRQSKMPFRRVTVASVLEFVVPTSHSPALVDAGASQAAAKVATPTPKEVPLQKAVPRTPVSTVDV